MEPAPPAAAELPPRSDSAVPLGVKGWERGRGVRLTTCEPQWTAPYLLGDYRKRGLGGIRGEHKERMRGMRGRQKEERDDLRAAVDRAVPVRRGVWKVKGDT
jgi:hypothetical protein